MNLQELIDAPNKSLRYLDRYVNDGSPSGFTEIMRSSFRTDPFSYNKDFFLYVINAGKSDIEIYGEHPINLPVSRDEFLIHPDMVGHNDLHGLQLKHFKGFSVTPTSSSRTVQINDEKFNDYIKLHYDGVLGRVNRKLSKYKAISGVEISNILTNAIQKSIFDTSIGIYREKFAKIYRTPREKNENNYWGMIWREGEPINNIGSKFTYIIPLFSFWSKDRRALDDESLGVQLHKVWGGASANMMLNSLMIPLIDAFFEPLIKLGLQNEYNSQNILIGLDENLNPDTIIFRDLMGVEKDIDLRNQLGLYNEFDSHQYKVISSLDTDYAVRHSFAFDCKVCHYVIKPLIDFASRNGIMKESIARKELKNRVEFWAAKLPNDFYPKGKWYKHPNTLLINSRIYNEMEMPYLRD